MALAEWLEAQDQVAWVNYPGLKSSKYDLAKEYLPRTKRNRHFWAKGRF
jgi:O-acetylhomoserine (thiol)-lyase